METIEAEEKSFEVYFRNYPNPLCVRAEKYQLATTEHEQLIQFFQSGDVLLLHIYIQPLDEVRIETLPLPESKDD